MTHNKSKWLAVFLLLTLLMAACSIQTPTPIAEDDEAEDADTGDADTADDEGSDEEADTGPVTQGGFPMAEITNDEGGPVVITGEVAYTNPFFTAGVAEPLVILEDQAGFVDRDQGFLMPLESQTIGQITSDFFTSPFSYTIALPAQPQGSLRDVDFDDEEDTGLMVFAVAYWTNTFGDPFLEKRDLYGGGWSTAYASTRVSEDAETEREIIGGKLVVYAGDNQQGFPENFGADGLLFTGDEDMVALPQGWTIVDLDSDPFTFDRSEAVTIDLIEPEGAALDDFSEMGYAEAFDALVGLMRDEYAFTEYKDIDWDALHEELRPRFEEADSEGDPALYEFALRDFTWSIPDGHVGMPFTQELVNAFFAETDGGIGMAIRDVDDGRVIVNYLLPGGPADEAGIELGASIISIDGTPVDDHINAQDAWSAPFSTDHVERLQKLRYAVRFPADSEVEVVFQNPGGSEQTVTLSTTDERESFNFSSFNTGLTGIELPLEYEILDNGYGYVQIFSFFDNQVLTIQLWERMIQTFKEQEVRGIIIDMRQNGGGSGFLADQMAAYFFDEELELGNAGFYDESLDEFYFDEATINYFYPPAEELRYDGPVAVLVGPSCASACEFFSYDMSLQERALIVGQYPTAGLGGSVTDVAMPDGITVRFTTGRAVDAEGNIHIEGIGVVPTVPVPVTEETLLTQEDVVLSAAVDALGKPRGAGITPDHPPTAEGGFDFVGALVAGAELLNDLAVEEYSSEELAAFEDGQVFTYTVPLSKSDEYIWYYAWCTETEEQFTDNWSKIQLEFTINGETIPNDDFGIYEGDDFGGPCRIYYIKLNDWAVGENVLRVDVTFTAAMNDGSFDYNPGTHSFEYHVFLAP